jgi:thiol-disulfide isomerase/thioredoxin
MSNNVKHKKVTAYMADWCGYCIKLKPHWYKFKKAYENNASEIRDKFNITLEFKEYYENKEKDKQIIARRGIKGYPTIHVVSDNMLEPYLEERTSEGLFSLISPKNSDFKKKFLEEVNNIELADNVLAGGARKSPFFTQADINAYPDSYKKYMKYRNKCLELNLILEDDY